MTAGSDDHPKTTDQLRKHMLAIARKTGTSPQRVQELTEHIDRLGDTMQTWRDAIKQRRALMVQIAELRRGRCP